MKIVVCVKQVPDTWAEKKLSPTDQTLDRDSADSVMNELDEYAVEEALQLAEKHSGEVTVLTMGPEKAAETIRKALSMGADAGIHVVDDGIHGSDALGHVDRAGQGARHRRVGPRHPRLRVHRRADVRRAGDARRAPRRPAADLRREGRRRRLDGPDPAPDRVRPRRGRGVRPRRSCRWSRRSTSRATRPSRGSWRPRRSRSPRSPWPTSASTPRGRPGRRVDEGRRGHARARRGPRARSSRTRATAAYSWPTSSRRRSSSEKDGRHPMAEVLVLVEHVDGDVKKVTSELLTLARTLGEPSAVFVGSGFDAARGQARRVRRGQGLRRRRRGARPTTSSRRRRRCWRRSSPTRSPAAVLIASTAEGKEIAGRLAVRTGSGVLTDAVAVDADLVASQSVFGGSTVVRSSVTHGHADHHRPAELDAPDRGARPPPSESTSPSRSPTPTRRRTSSSAS